jgi:internalin A
MAKAMAKDKAYQQAEAKIEAALRSGAKELALCDNWPGLTELPESLSQLTALQSLNLSYNQLTALPESLGQLTALQSLDISENQLTALPESLSQLTALQSLNLSSNQLTALPESLGQLTALQSLDLSNNLLTALPELLGQLTELKSLDLYTNKLVHLAECVVELKQLNSLMLADNPIELLPNNIGELRELRSMTLGATKIRELPESFRKLKNLEFLSISNTPMTRLPEWIGDLISLQGLDLTQGGSLVLLWVEHTKIWQNESELEMHIGLELLPESLRNLPSLSSLYLHGNESLALPAEVLGPGWNETQHSKDRKQPARPADILDYYFRTQRGRRRLNEAKLILVGRGGVGKTCLIKRLIHNTFDEHEQETPGIEIQPWRVTLADGDRVRLHVWDFGGQEILHATHQFFLTERTVYLLVLSGREGSATHDAEYWLQLIKSFGGDSPIIVALNKSIQHPFDVNRGLLLEKYPQIAAFVRTDCQNAPDGSLASNGALGVAELHQSVLDATENLGLRKTDFPADWFDIKERLAAMEENFLTWDYYQEICRNLGEMDAKAQRDLAGFLHILGIALNYRDDPRLRETHVLNPRWVTEGIYSLLRIGQKERQEREGVLEKADLAGALDAKDYPPASHEFLLALMEKFQLCFQLPGRRKRYLVPELLGENQPDEIRSLVTEPGLGFRYQYEVLPEGLLPRFIVQTHVHSESNPKWRWRTGVVLNRDGCRAVVRADARERRVDIHISGPARQRRGLLAIIRDRFDEQHSDLKGLVVDQRVPVPGEPGVTVSYDFLLKLEGKGKSSVWPEGAQQEYPVADLLNGVDSPERRAERHSQKITRRFEVIMSNKHVFLSYCHDNTDEAEQLHDDLIAAGEAVWWDQDILPGQDWEQEIDQAMRDAYAVLVCLSEETESRTTTGIYPEAAKAIGALLEYAPGNIFLIPVRFSDCKIPNYKIDATRRLDKIQFVNLFPPAKRPANLKKLIAALQSALDHP